jgi:hypothetical protein
MTIHASVEQQLDAEYTCLHPTTEVRRKQYARSSRLYRQCTICGTSLGSVPQRDLPPPPEALAAVPEYDDSLSAIWKQRRKARRKELVTEHKAAEKAAWWRKYNEYLASDAWREKRERVFRRERLLQRTQTPLCQECYERPGAITHHTSYRNVFSERTHELILVCSRCHDAIHGVLPWPV